MAGLTTMRVGYGASDARTLASGAITVDGDRSTPVLMPYSGQVVRVLADADPDSLNTVADAAAP